MNETDFHRLVRDWYKPENQHTRLGQFLINNLNPPVTDPRIFYEEDPDTAYSLFFGRYVAKRG